MVKDKICEGDYIVDYVIKLIDFFVEKYVFYIMFELFKRILIFFNKKKINLK